MHVEAKHPDCWEAARKLNVQWPYNLASGQLTRREASDQVRTGVKDQRMLNGIAAQTAIVQAGGIFWQDVLRWGRERQVLSPKETGLLNVCCRIPSQIPTEGQSIAVMGVYDRLGSLGLPFALC